MFSQNAASGAFQLIALTFIRSHVAAARVFLVGTWHAALIRLQQMTLAISAATGVSRINRRASGRQSLRECRTAVLLQGAKQRICSVQVASIVEHASAVAAQIVTIGGDRAVAVPAHRILRDNAVLDCSSTVPVANAPSPAGGGIVSDSAAVDYQSAAVIDATANPSPVITSDGAIVDRRRGLIVDASSAAGSAALIGVDSAAIDGHRPQDRLNAASPVRSITADGAALNRQHSKNAVNAASLSIVGRGPVPSKIAADRAIVDRQTPAIVDSASKTMIFDATVSGRGIRSNRAVTDRQGSAVVDARTNVGRAISNSQF